MKLDVVVPTYNRSWLLRRTLASLLRASEPAGLELTILVVDNNSKDDTRMVVEQMQAESTRRLLYIKETRQGSSRARNAGISAGSGEAIGFIDDDEEVDEQWLHVVVREFADEATQFIGGPYLANCTVPMPAWLPTGYNGVIGVIDPKPRALYGPSFPGNLPSGNAVLRRSVFERVGLYDVTLGRSGKGLLSEEDAELYRRIVDAGIRGFHVPDLVIYHYIPPERLTRSYYRRWCYWRGVSHGIADRTRKEPVAYLCGLPRYRIRQALSGLMAIPGNVYEAGDARAVFSRELALWDLFGFARGKYFARVENLYGSDDV